MFNRGGVGTEVCKGEWCGDFIGEVSDWCGAEVVDELSLTEA